MADYGYHKEPRSDHNAVEAVQVDGSFEAEFRRFAVKSIEVAEADHVNAQERAGKADECLRMANEAVVEAGLRAEAAKAALRAFDNALNPKAGIAVHPDNMARPRY